MAKNILFGNVMPSPSTPVATGNANADAAIRELQAWPMSPYVPMARPTGKEYVAAVRTAEAVGPAALLGLLDDAAVATGVSQWSDKHLASLATADRKLFKTHYEQVLAALAVRKAYLHWLIGAVCNTPAGLDRALEIVTKGTLAARLVAADSLWSNLQDSEAKRRLAHALDLRRWDGEDDRLERVYRAGVALLGNLDPAGAHDHYAELLSTRALKKPGGNVRADSLLYGLIATEQPDPRWTATVLPLLKTELDNLAIMLLAKLPADPIARAPLCEFLPKPDAKAGWWHDGAVVQLARVADRSSLPWLVAALKASWMNWPAVFEGFRRVGDPAMAHVIREWLADNGAPDRNKVGLPLIKDLERKGAAPKPSAPLLAKPAKPAPVRPVLKYKRVAAFKRPKLDTLAVQTEVYRKAFAAGGLAKYFELLAQRAVLMIPKRVDETKLEPGHTKLGGNPDLPAKTEWPRVAGEPLTFLAQIALREVAPFLPKRVLPASGLLSFFMGTDPDGSAGYCENARVIFTPIRAKLIRREVPEDFANRIYQAATVEFHAALRLPSPSNKHVTKLLKGKALASYEQDVFDDSPALPQLLGFRNHGWDAEEPATAQMLLQLTGDSQTDMEFGDMDFAAFYIAKQRLAKADFSKVWPRVGD